MSKIHFIALLFLPFLCSCIVASSLVEETQSKKRFSRSINYANSILKDQTQFPYSETVNSSYPKDLQDIILNLEKTGFTSVSTSLKEISTIVASESVNLISPIVNNKVNNIPVNELEGFLYQELGSQSDYLKEKSTPEIKSAISPIIYKELNKEVNKNLFNSESLNNFKSVFKKNKITAFNYNKLTTKDLGELLNTFITESYFNLMKERELSSTFLNGLVSSSQNSFSSESNENIDKSTAQLSNKNLNTLPKINPEEIYYDSSINKNIVESTNSANNIVNNSDINLVEDLEYNTKSNNNLITTELVNTTPEINDETSNALVKPITNKIVKKYSANSKYRSTSNKYKKPLVRKRIYKKPINLSGRNADINKLNSLREEIRKIKKSVNILESKLR